MAMPDKMGDAKEKRTETILQGECIIGQDISKLIPNNWKFGFQQYF